MAIFKLCKCISPTRLIWIKFCVMLGIAIITPYVTHILEFQESKYVGIIFYGYVCFRIWGKEKPDKYLGIFWKFCRPFLFGSIGASIQFSKIETHIFGKSIIVILCGLIVRWIATYFASIN